MSKAYASPLVDSSKKKQLGIEGWTESSLSAGQIQTSFPGDWSHPIREAWAEMFKTRGQYMTKDPFLSASTGGFSCLSSIHPATKERSNSYSEYYHPSKHRQNLQIITNAVVTRILFDSQDGNLRAVGVQYTQDNKTIQVHCKKEVILAAGVINSPKILELSGIGDFELLSRYGINVVQNNPGVGENLHDHMLASIDYEAIDDLATLDALVRQEPEAIAQAMEEYTNRRTGLLTSVGVNTYAYLAAMDCASEEEQRKLKGLFEQNRPPPEKGIAKSRAQAYHEIAEKTLLEREPSGAYLSILAQHTLPVDPASELPEGKAPGKYLSIGLMLAQPLSRGSVHIQSSDVAVPPNIDPNYFSNPLDIEVMAQHMKYIETLITSPPLSKLVKHPLRRRDPASGLVDTPTAKKFLQTSAISMWHLVGTCSMLPKEKGGVVNDRLQVYGVGNLRIVDASAIPLVSTANLQSTVYAFAERAAALIKEEYRLK